MTKTLIITEEENGDILRAIKAQDLALALLDVQNLIRSKVKYGVGDQRTMEWQLEKLQAEFYSILDSRNLNIEELLE